jgi:hypothetical protein
MSGFILSNALSAMNILIKTEYTPRAVFWLVSIYSNYVAYDWIVKDKWMNDCCLMPTQQFFSYICISWREQVNFQWDDDEVRFVLEQHA